jgi:predicted Zn-dependent protease with MMP-like domain
MVDVERDRFEAVVGEALDVLPSDVGRMMRTVAAILDHDNGPLGLLGLYRGIGPLDQPQLRTTAVFDQITIYRRAVCAGCRTGVEVVEQVRRTVVHEVGHHVGIGDARLHELGW